MARRCRGSFRSFSLRWYNSGAGTFWSNAHANFFSMRSVARGRPRRGILAMSSGFNSDVNAGGEVCHVQTEDHGQPDCLIETLVYHRGRIFHRATSNYSDLATAPGFSEGALRERVENQHRAVIDAIRDGAIAIPAVANASVEAHLTGTKEEARFSTTTAADGVAQLRFTMPPLGPDGSELVIRAGSESGNDEVRYALRAKAKSAPQERKS